MGHRFTLGTDHAPVNWLYGVKKPEGQVAEQLQELNFKIIHRPDQRYQNADTLSRSPCRQCGHTGEDDKNNESATIATLQLSSYVSANIKDNEMEDQELQLIITAKQFNESIAPAQQAARSLQLHWLLQIWNQLTVPMECCTGFPGHCTAIRYPQPTRGSTMHAR